jgi:hypothetical protein
MSAKRKTALAARSLTDAVGEPTVLATAYSDRTSALMALFCETLQGIPSVVHSLRSPRLRSTRITSRRATPLGLRETVPLALMSRLNPHTTG